MDCCYKLYMVKTKVPCRKDFLGSLLFCIDVFAVLDMASSPNVEVHFCHIFVGVVWLVWLRDGRGEEECDWKEIPRLPHPARSDRHLWRGNGWARWWALWDTGWHRVNPRVFQIGSKTVTVDWDCRDCGDCRDCLCYSYSLYCQYIDESLNASHFDSVIT